MGKVSPHCDHETPHLPPPGLPYSADWCRACWNALYTPAYQRLWGLSSANPPGRYAGDCLRRLDETNLSPGLPGLRFNPSLLKWGDGYLLAYRHLRDNSEIYLTQLDTSFVPTGTSHKLELRHPESFAGREDPRLFLYQNRVYVSFSALGGRRVSMMYARLSDDLRVEELFLPHYARRNLWEKNWVFFQHKDTLYAIYGVAPHRVLKIDGNRATDAFETPNRAPWDGGERRGGASPVLVGDEFWCFFHDKVCHGRDHYRAGLYTFAATPPFRVRRAVRHPVLEADPTTNPGTDQDVLFVGGAVHDGTDWVLACGAHDRWSELHRLRHADLEARLIQISPPAGWAWRPGSADEDIFASVNACDEYELDRYDLEGGAVLDVGGQIGSFAYAADRKRAAIIHSYEPWEENFLLLEHNVKFLRDVTAFEEALGGAEGVCSPLPHPKGSVGSMRMRPGKGGVKLITLNRAIERLTSVSPDGRVRLLKLDCEGGEWLALESCTLLDLVDYVLGEYHGGVEAVIAGAGTRSEADLRRLLTGKGFTNVRTRPTDESPMGLFWASRG